MAGDWIKMRTDLYRDPKVIAIADILMDSKSDLSRFVNQHNQRDMSVTRNVMRNVTVGALVSVWGVTRNRGERDGDDLFVEGVTPQAVDDIADLPGFGHAMVASGWLIENAQGIVFPKFFATHNVDPNDYQKKSNRERQQRFRKKKRNVTRNVTVTHRAEQSRDIAAARGGDLDSVFREAGVTSRKVIADLTAISGLTAKRAQAVLAKAKAKPGVNNPAGMFVRMCKDRDWEPQKIDTAGDAVDAFLAGSWSSVNGRDLAGHRVTFNGNGLYANDELVVPAGDIGKSVFE